MLHNGCSTCLSCSAALIASTSLLAGEGASLGMAGAYLLAGELAAAGGDHRVAFARYQSLFKPIIDCKQRAARRFGRWFARTRTPACCCATPRPG
jgi:2-polyprenyl-6-methoxyphenol hydroxylase-like FAD-dependent oxidoreductase